MKSVKSTEQTKISVLGQSGEILEYTPKADVSSRFEQKEDGLHISVVRAQRIYNNSKWPNPIVVKIENVEPALDPPVAKTLSAALDGNKVTVHGELVKKGVGD